MNRIEKVVRELSDLRDFYLRITRGKKRIAEKKKSLFSENQASTYDTNHTSEDGGPLHVRKDN